MEYEEIKEEKGLLNWLEKLYDFGLCVVKNVPKKEGEVIRVAERISYIRETSYGRLFDVISLPNAINIAYTNLHLKLHMDLGFFSSFFFFYLFSIYFSIFINLL